MEHFGQADGWADAGILVVRRRKSGEECFQFLGLVNCMGVLPSLATDSYVKTKQHS